MPLSERKKIILKAVVENFIVNAEPIGSKTLAAETGLNLSSATIRNELSELESLGYLEQPHTSAGRIPSNLGYRIYVDDLMNSQNIPRNEAEKIERALFRRLRELDELIAEAGRLISDLTNYAAFSSLSQAGNVYLRRVDLIPVDRDSFVIVLIYSANIIKNTISKRQPEITDEKLHIISTLLNVRFFNKLPVVVDDEFVREVAERSGTPVPFVHGILEYICQSSTSVEQNKVYTNIATNILDLPEYQDVSRARRLISYMSDTESLASMAMPADTKLKILIGPENVQEELKDSSVIMVSYDMGGGMRGMIGVVGPTRMDYPGVESRLRYFSRRLNRFLNGECAENE